MKIPKNPRQAFLAGRNEGVQDGQLATEYFTVAALYNVACEFFDDDETIRDFIIKYLEEMGRIISDELRGDGNLIDNIDYAVQKVEELRAKLGLERGVKA